MTTALNLPGVIVDSVTVQLRDDGTNRRARLGLTYGAAVDPDHKAMVKLTSGLLHEPRLFNSKVELPLEHPHVYAAVVDEADEDFMLVMEDLVARGADPRDSTRPYTVEEVAEGVRGLARMHGRFWGHRVERPELDWLEPFVPWDGMQYAPLPAALEALGDDAPASVRALTIEALLEGARAGPYRGLPRRTGVARRRTAVDRRHLVALSRVRRTRSHAVAGDGERGCVAAPRRVGDAGEALCRGLRGSADRAGAGRSDCRYPLN